MKNRKAKTGELMQIKLSPMMSTALTLAGRESGGLRRTEIVRRYIAEGLRREGYITEQLAISNVQ